MTTSTPAAVELCHITKRFPGVVANDDVSMAVQPGEIHALLGENGAGKSTLMSILCGLYRPDAGEIRIHGAPVDFGSPRAAIRAGVGMVHQHFMLTSSQTVTENVLLGLRHVPFVLNTKQQAAQVRRIGEQYGLPVDPHARIWQLSVGEQQRVEIIKMLYRGTDILILDEPTAVLTPPESAQLVQTLHAMTAQGQTIIFISHKLDEVLAIADRITVLRHGKQVATVNAATTSKPELAELMVGRTVLFHLEKYAVQPGENRLMLHAVRAHDDKQLPALRGVSLDVRAGEIVGIAGVAGNGQRELAEVISGLRPTQSGRIEIAGQTTSHAPDSARALLVIAAGLAYIPEDRSATGSAPNLSVWENLALRMYRGAHFGSRFWLHRRRLQEHAHQLVAQYDIATPHVHAPVRQLSGGNLQKLILAREISSRPQVILAAYPTRGLDIGATENVRNILLEQRARGTAILLISEDLDELFALSDRIAVLFDGRIVGEMSTATADRQTIGLMMAGDQLTISN